MSATLRIHNPDQEVSGPELGTLGDFASRYKQHMQRRIEAGDLDPEAAKNVYRYLDSFLDYRTEKGVRVGDHTPAEAQQVHLTNWLFANYDHWKSGATRADAIGFVLGCFNTLEEQRVIDVSPFRRPRHLKFPRTHLKAMRKHHFRAIYWAASRLGRKTLYFRLMLFACWYTGVRLGEFRMLEPNEIDWDAVVRLSAKKNKTGRITGEERIIGVGNRLLSVLWNLCEQRKKDGKKFVFLSPRGKPWTSDNLGRHYAKFRELAGVPTDIYMRAVRHGYAVRILSDGETSAKAVADQLGHRGTRMVESIYAAETRYDAELVKGVAAKAERGRKPSPPRESVQAAAKRRDDKKASPLFEGLE